MAVRFLYHPQLMYHRNRVEAMEIELGRLRHEQRETRLQLELAYERQAELQRELRETGLLSQESKAVIRSALRTLEQTISVYEQAAMELSQHIQLQVEKLVLARRDVEEARHLTNPGSEALSDQTTRPETSVYDEPVATPPMNQTVTSAHF
jgi:flagellar biosynthesis chaperone FliJ